MSKKKVGGRREPPGGRPPKGNIRLVCYVQPETRKAIDDEATREKLTLGQVIDRWMKRQGVIDRLRAIRERFTREDTGQGFGRPEIAWAMADDLRILIEELESDTHSNSGFERGTDEGE